MINTFNRRPLSVNTPDGKDVEHKYLNQFNWKGLVDNKNFLAVDQESFADCNNVYVDEQGLLKSRPSLKVKTININTNDTKIILTDIIDMWTFDDIIVYKTFVKDKYYLTFVNNNFENAIQQETSENIKLFLVDKKIFVFSENEFSYYSVEENSYNNAEEFIYIPITKSYINNIEDKDIETPNILTTKQIYKYIYDNIYQDFTYVYDKDVKIKIDNKVYYTKFVKNKESVLVSKGRELFEENYNSLNIPMIWANDTCTILGFINKYEGIETITAKYSFDNIVFYDIEFPPNTILNTDPVPFVFLTDDGHHLIVFKKDGPYIKSIIKDDYDGENTVYKFNDWTSLFEYNNILFNVDITESVNYPVAFSAHFKTYDDFCFTYASDYLGTNVTNNIEGYGTLNLVYKLNDSFIKKELFSSKSSEQTVDISTVNRTDYTSFNVSTMQYVDLSTDGHDLLDFVSFSLKELDTYGGGKQIKFIGYGSFGTSYSFSINEGDNFIITEGESSVSLYGNSPYSGIDEKMLLAKLSISEIDNKLILKISPVKINNYYPLKSNATEVIDNNKYLSYIPIEKGEYTCKSKVCSENITLVNFKKSLLNVSNNNLYNLVYLNVLTEDEVKIYTADQTYFGLSYGEPILNDIFLKNSYSNYYNKNVTSIYWSYTVNNELLKIEKIYLNTGVVSIKIDDSEDIGIIKFYNNGFITNNNLYRDEVEYEIDKGYIKSLSIYYNKIPLLFDSIPLYISSSKLYLSNRDGDKKYLYSNNVKNIQIDVTIDGETKYFVPNTYTELNEIYFSKDKSLYITSSRRNDNYEFMWYLPELNKQDFNFNITNLHPISSTEVAIFLLNEVYYTVYDTDISAYRYYKTKLQVGCKKGCDVITTFDGKYVIFPSERGLVAMSYQQFVATTEQSLDYLSDNIYSIFHNYLTESGSKNEIKLYKHSYWIFVYKQDSKKGFLLDMRNLSWWPVEGMYNTSKFVEMDNKTVLLSNNKLFSLNTNDTYYFDNDGKLKARIRWFVKSQKLHLNALNYYKHIVNITFASVHDVEALKQSQHNIQNTNLKLQVNNYRKKIDGNIDSKDDWSVVHYNIDIVRTYIQRLNYSKVNEFQYMLSYDNQTALNVPLSLSNITIKYKIGGQIR